MKIMEKVADLFHATQEYIRDHGWTQGTLYNADTSHVCMVGAMAFGQGLFEYDNDDLDLMRAEHQEMNEAMWLLFELIHPEWGSTSERQREGSPVCEITGWNDADGRTQQEVEDLLAKAEKIARAGYDPDQGVPL